MNKIIYFYQTPGTYTNPKTFCNLLRSLPDDSGEIIHFIKKVLIHPLKARNSNVRFDYKKALRSQADHRSVDDILANPKVHALLQLNTLDFDSTPAQRGILSCDHHAVLFAAILRLKGKPVRARCGYATYLVPGKLTPHWICEVYDEQAGIWNYIDPEQAGIPLTQSEFVLAGKVWLDVKEGKLDPARVLPDYREGLDGIKYRLLNDINALMKNELLNYEWMIKEAAPEAPKLFSKPVLKLDDMECSFLNRLAFLSLDADANWTELNNQYSVYVQPENLRTAPQ